MFLLLWWQNSHNIVFIIHILKWTIQLLNAFTVLCTDCPYCSKAFHPFRRKRLPWSSYSPSHSCSGPGNYPVYVMSLWICVFWIFYIHGSMHYVTFCVWLLFTWYIFKIHPHCSTYQHLIPFYGWIIFHYICYAYIYIKICLFIYWWTFKKPLWWSFGLFLLLGYCKCCYIYVYIYIYLFECLFSVHLLYI